MSHETYPSEPPSPADSRGSQPPFLGAFGFFIVEQEDVRVTKSVQTIDTRTVQLVFVVGSTRQTAVEIEFSDQLPSSSSRWESVVRPEHEGQHWVTDTDSLSCRRLIEPGETVEITHQLSVQQTDETEFYSRPVIERVSSVESRDCSRRSPRESEAESSDQSTAPVSNGGDREVVSQSAESDQPRQFIGQVSETVIAAMPAYNEESMIDQTVSEAQPYVDSVLVVDDGSTDETAARAAEAGAEVVSHDYNRGYGAALQTIFTEAHRRNAQYLVIVDSDGQHDLTDIPALVERQQTTDAEIVIGSRFVEGSDTDLPRYRWVGITVVNLLTNISMGIVRPQSRIADTQSGFRSYNQQAISSLSETDRIGESMGASTDILHHAHRQGYEISEVGSTIRYDVENPSSHNAIVHGYQLVRNILRTVERDRPILSLGVPGFLSAFGGLGLGYLTLSTTVRTGSVLLELAVVSILATLIGFLCCIFSIMLHTFNIVTDR